MPATLTAWRAPECPFPIECAAAVLEQIRVAAVDAFFSLPHGGVEIGGVLFGTRQGGRLRILASRPLDCEYALGPTFTLSEKDHARLRALLDEGCRDLRAQGLEPMGWYHSHTRSELLLSERDLEIHQRYFPEAWHVALVVRPHALQPMRAGFFFREADGSIHGESSYNEFLLQPEARAVAPPPLTEPLTDTGPRLTDIEPRLTEPQPSASGLPWLAVMLALMLAAGWLALQDHGMPASAHGQPPSVLLMAFDLKGQLQIRWDRAAEVIRAASAGSLEITDGPAKVAVPLDGQRLRSGTLSYARQTARVDLRLVLQQPGGRQFEEFTSFLGAPPDSSSDLVRLRNQLNKLERAVSDMRSRMRRQNQKE